MKSFVEAGAATIGSYFAGYVFDVVGSYKPAFWTGITISSIAVVLAMLIKPIMKGESNI